MPLIGFTEKDAGEQDSMNPVRKLRLRTGITQQELAVMARTSQSTIAAYESGSKSPTLRTLAKLADSQDLEMVTSYMPRLTREDRRSLAFHRAIAEILCRRPVAVRRRATRNLKKLTGIHPGAKLLFDRWRAWLALPVEETGLEDPGPSSAGARDAPGLSFFRCAEPGRSSPDPAAVSSARRSMN